MTSTIQAPAPRQLATNRATRRPKNRRSRFLRRLPLNIVVALLLVIVCYPLVWLVLGSFKTQDEFLSSPFWALPSTPDLSNYTEAFAKANLGTYLINSVLTVIPALIIGLALGTAAAFALEVLVWKGRGPTLGIFLVGITVPAQIILLPLFTMYFQLHLLGTLWPLIITYTAVTLPLNVFMIATFFKAAPRGMFEAAAIDGASTLRMFWSVGVPMVRNGIFTVGLVQFFFLWNDLLFALTFTNNPRLRTVQVGLLSFNGQYGSIDYGPLFAAIVVSISATLLLYLFMNQRVMRGLAAGSMKG
ncbi:raffinose/stachyose/melibiose transport system permease protein [Kribbella sp. VKM Ac-2527]|uniref:Raffinose/stachyose/melibiose transport system permease protein n=1 Tax=Kribbella caucasensis TaxID=2512215 RepID=A0A4R6KKZ2_9ACTN|nr:carbohydrate ABC transporter permease [Kribbella sp. VKM Ac-2527]TDO51671.1 raffinose/stachyose/melibiose transport system permease protein [Kribbella sp. VKM Ac-2527]